MINGLSEEMLDEKTPPEVQVTDEPREPVQDPRLGIDLEVTVQGTSRHRLVVIGDSLSHGFQSGAIYNTDISYPAIIAYEMGWYDHFRHPNAGSPRVASGCLANVAPSGFFEGCRHLRCPPRR